MLTELSRIRVVLVNTSHPGNIGAVARAMKNMGLSRLWLVEPQDYPSAEATARASGADDVLAGARVVASLEEAVADCALVVGSSARVRTIPWPNLEPRACAARMIETATTDEVALVMGRERTGLTNAELERCRYHVHIPANPDYGSLNLAAATQVLVYELRMAALQQAGREPPDWHTDHPPVTAAELEGLYAHLEQTLVELEFLDPANPRQLMRRLRRLFNRAGLDQMELNILRGILTAAQKARRRGEERGTRSEKPRQ
ncbi:MAG TPA: tRNA (cytosine(32)/uridine(32)-2'-O)-methyltransferase TrmJ [Chromatiales bacterium]|nr:tRNA (cytosine(32)/uridine(32)-2'-O)-methyltransferase TrmJ [Chromatiales bacterium]